MVYICIYIYIYIYICICICTCIHIHTFMYIRIDMYISICICLYLAATLNRTHSGAPQHAATHCYTCQRTAATNNNTLQHMAHTMCVCMRCLYVGQQVRRTEHTATRCSTLQRTAIHDLTLQHRARIT